jgi:DNA polymerase III subunit gamma/tau
MSSYQVIARKYRPQTFGEVVGQEHVSQTLRQAIATGRIAHAYLFCGPRGTGKTTIARIFAKCLRCEKGPTPEPCNECSECRAIMAGNSMDMLEFDAASNTQVDKIRDIIIEQVKYAPASGTYKMYLVDEVHMLSTSSFNALLKTLEEPPAHVKFLFATTDPEKLPATILSRCQRFDLRRIPIKLMVDHLRAIAKQEKVEIEDTALNAIARGADGGMRDGESALDQLISFCGEKIVEADVLSMFGLTSQSQLLSLTGALLKGDVPTVLGEFNELAQHGKDLGKFLADLLQHLRNLLVFQISRGDTRLLEVSEGEQATLTEQSSVVTSDALTRIMEVLTQTESGLRDASSKRIYIEVALMRAIEARNAVSIDAILKRLNELRGDAGAASTATPAAPVTATRPAVASSAPSAAPAIPRPAPKPAAETPLAPAAPAAPVAPAAASTVQSEIDLQGLWPNLIDAIGRASPFARSYFLEAHPVSFARGVFTIGFDPEFADHIGMVDNAKNHALITTKLSELGIPGAQVKIIKAERPDHFASPAAPVVEEPKAPAPRPTSTGSAPAKQTAAAPPKPAADVKPIQMDPSEFKNDPLIKKALEIFKGTIVEVRA